MPSTNRMTCCFSGKESQIERLFVLYYPPALAHASWDKSVYAAARAGEAVQELKQQLREFHSRYVVGQKLPTGILMLVVGLALVGLFAYSVFVAPSQPETWLLVLLALVATIFVFMGQSRIRKFLNRRKRWNEEVKALVAKELEEIEADTKDLGDDPLAEDAMVVMRRICPDALSEIAFEGTYFRAFTYMDFVLYPALKHPQSKDEIPNDHNFHRDAYYVGDVWYDGWRLFHKNQKDLVDPRFVGSGGKRGVL